MKLYKISNLQYSRRRPFLYNGPTYFPTVVFAVLLGTYLDLFFTGIGMYSFPGRPLEKVFQIQIFFNLVGLPVFTWIFLKAGRRLSRKGRFFLIIFLSLGGPALEILSESRGLFWHTGEWKHWYSFIGYSIFLVIVWNVFKWTNARGNK